MDSIPPTLPFHLAKAYGVKPSVNTPATTPTVKVTPVAPGVDRIDSARGSERVDKLDLAVAKKTATLRQRLVAAIVPGGVEFENGIAKAVTGPARADKAAPIPFYRHPADKNAAATAINLGSRLDTRG